MSYKLASKLAQAKLRRPIGDMLPSYFENLTEEEKRDCLKQVLFSLEEELKNETDRWRKKELGKRKFEIQTKMHAIRPKRKVPGVENYFIDVCRDRMTKTQFKLFMDLAVKKMKETK